MRTFPALTLAALLALPTLAHAQTTYPIECNRLFKTGESYNIHYTYDLTSNTLGGMVGKTPDAQSKTIKADLTARIDNVRADPAHNAQAFTLTINHLINGNTKRDCIRPGTVLTVLLDSTQTTFLPAPNAFPVPDNAKNLLRNVFPFIGSTQKSFVDASAPQSLGSSWKINADAAVDFFKINHILITPFDITGSASLTKVDDSNKTLAISATIHGKDFGSDLLPDRATIEKSELTVTYNLLAPIDPHSPLLSAITTLDSNIHINSVTSTILVDSKVHMILNQSITPIPTATAKLQ